MTGITQQTSFNYNLLPCGLSSSSSNNMFYLHFLSVFCFGCSIVWCCWAHPLLEFSIMSNTHHDMLCVTSCNNSFITNFCILFNYSTWPLCHHLIFATKFEHIICYSKYIEQDIINLTHKGIMDFFQYFFRIITPFSNSTYLGWWSLTGLHLPLELASCLFVQFRQDNLSLKCWHHNQIKSNILFVVDVVIVQ